MTEELVRKTQEGRKGSATPLPSLPPKQRCLLPSSLCVPPGKQQREEAGLGKKDLWSQPTCSHRPGKKVKDKEEDQRSNVSLKPSLEVFLPRCCHLHCTTPTLVVTSARRREPAAGNEQFSLTLRQKQLKKKKKGKSHDFFFPSLPPARKHIWQSLDCWKPSAGLPALQRLRGGGQARASRQPCRGHCPRCPGVPHHVCVGGSPAPSHASCCLQRAPGRAGVP